MYVLRMSEAWIASSEKCGLRHDELRPDRGQSDVSTVSHHHLVRPTATFAALCLLPTTAHGVICVLGLPL
jgi:hypothetical protein